MPGGSLFFGSLGYPSCCCVPQADREHVFAVVVVR